MSSPRAQGSPTRCRHRHSTHAHLRPAVVVVLLRSLTCRPGAGSTCGSGVIGHALVSRGSVPMRSVCRLAGGTARHGTARRGLLGRGGRGEGDIGRRGGVCGWTTAALRRCNFAVHGTCNPRRLLVVTSELNRWDPPEEVGRHGGSKPGEPGGGSWRDDMRHSPCADGAGGLGAHPRRGFVIMYERASDFRPGWDPPSGRKSARDGESEPESDGGHWTLRFAEAAQSNPCYEWVGRGLPKRRARGRRAETTRSGCVHVKGLSPEKRFMAQDEV